MAVVQWPTNVNQKVFGLNGGFTENTEKVEYKSGRTISYLKNSTPKKTFSLSIRLEDSKKKREFLAFINWYEDELKSGTNTFMFPDVFKKDGTLTEYRLDNTPTWNGQRFKTVELTFIEV